MRVPRLRCLQPCSASNGGTVAERRNRGTRGFKLDGILGPLRFGLGERRAQALEEEGRHYGETMGRICRIGGIVSEDRAWAFRRLQAFLRPSLYRRRYRARWYIS